MPEIATKDLDGKRWGLPELRGKWTVVSLWGVYCLPCREEQPTLQTFYLEEASRKDVQLLTVSIDAWCGNTCKSAATRFRWW